MIRKVCFFGPKKMRFMQIESVLQTKNRSGPAKNRFSVALLWVLEYYQVCSNDDPGLTLTYFRARSNLIPYAFVWEKGKTMNISETIVVYDVKAGRCS